MNENVTSILNKNTFLYSSAADPKNLGPDCVEGRGEETKEICLKPVEAPIKAVREK